MIGLKEALFIYGIFAVFGDAVRVVRTPDKLEVNIPNYSYERESGEYQDNMNQETAYWQGQGDKLGDEEEKGHQQLEDNRDKNQDNYEHEKEHHEEQQHNINNEMNETYQEDRDKTEGHYETNQEHYMQYYIDTNYDIPEQTNKTAEGVTHTETGERYEEKGTEYVEDGQDKLENQEVN